jgi:hypothetical protein
MLMYPDILICNFHSSFYFSYGISVASDVMYILMSFNENMELFISFCWSPVKSIIFVNESEHLISICHCHSSKL